jgi:hypothetical protein
MAMLTQTTYHCDLNLDKIDWFDQTSIVATMTTQRIFFVLAALLHICMIDNYEWNRHRLLPSRRLPSPLSGLEST